MPGRNIYVVGSINIDFVIPVQRTPAPGETLLGGDLVLVPGGKGSNQACAAGKLTAGRKAGVEKVWMVGQVGNDAFASLLIESLRKATVDTSLIGSVDGASGCASIYVTPQGENSIVISPGANAKVDPNFALSRLKRLKEKDIVLLQLEIPIETVMAVAQFAAERQAIVILDPAPARSLQSSLLNSVDYLTPNETEARALLGDSLKVDDSWATLASAIHRLGPKSVILKLGDEGCFLLTKEFADEHVPPFPVTPVDTTAAGDVFNGAFAVGLADGMDEKESAVFASAAAAFSVTRQGAQTSVPTYAETKSLLMQR